MPPRCQVRAALVLAAAPIAGAITLSALAGRLAAAPVVKQAEGTYTDDFTDATGLSSRQNVKLGSALAPGVRVSLTSWSFAQSYTQASDAVSRPFSHPGGAHRLTTPNQCATCLWESVTLWNVTYRAGRDLVLGPAVVSSTMDPRFPPGPYPLGFDFPEPRGLAHHGDSSALAGNYFVRGPYAGGLEPERSYTVTFRPFYCDNETCDNTADTLPGDGPELARFDVFHGTVLDSFTMHLKNYENNCSPTRRGDFSCEYAPSPVTLEWKVPYPLPTWKGWEYRVLMSQTVAGLSASLWLDEITVMARGREIAPTAYIAPGSCPPGTVACGHGCQAPWLPCGWDAATTYVDEGSYVSPVFDSLSELTVWDRFWWRMNQNGGAVSLKWRVGNTPDPATWLADPSLYTWTIPLLVTSSCTGCPYPGVKPMRDVDFATLYADGGWTTDANGDPVKAVGRYFQYEADFTSNYGQGYYPPELAVTGNDANGQPRFARELHEAVTPSLRQVRIFYQPARGQVVSATVTPSQLKAWKAVTFTADVSAGGSVQVDVLDEHDVPLFADVPSGFSLAGLDPRRYPRLRLRGWVDNGGVVTQRPVLLSWKLSWELLTEPLEISRNSLSLSRADTLTITTVFDAAKEGTVAVRDASGQLVRVFARGTIAAGVSRWTWDGANEHRAPVAPGVYFVSLHAGGVRKVRSVAVVP